MPTFGIFTPILWSIYNFVMLGFSGFLLSSLQLSWFRFSSFGLCCLKWCQPIAWLVALSEHLQRPIIWLVASRLVATNRVARCIAIHGAEPIKTRLSVEDICCILFVWWCWKLFFWLNITSGGGENLPFCQPDLMNLSSPNIRPPFIHTR